jgi:hypothetical protein
MFKSAFLTGLHPDEWAITEASIRAWAAEQRVHTTRRSARTGTLRLLELAA